MRKSTRIACVILIGLIVITLHVWLETQYSAWNRVVNSPGATMTNGYAVVSVDSHNLTILTNAHFTEKLSASLPYVIVNKTMFDKLIRSWNITIGYVTNYPDGKSTYLVFIHNDVVYVLDLGYPPGAIVSYHNHKIILKYPKPTPKRLLSQIISMLVVTSLFASLVAIQKCDRKRDFEP